MTHARTATVPPLVRIIRTLIQMLIAFPILVPVIVGVLHAVHVDSIDSPGLLTIAAVALVAVTTVQNFLERAGLIPTLGAQATDTTGREA